MKRGHCVLVTLISLLSGCGLNGMGGRELSGRLIPEVEGGINPRTGEFHYRSGKDFTLKAKGVKIGNNSIDEIEVASVASPVVKADTEMMGFMERMQERERSRLEYRDMMDAYKWQSTMQAVQNLGTAFAPTLIKPPVTESLSLPTPWGALGKTTTPGEMVKPVAPPTFQPAPLPMPGARLFRPGEEALPPAGETTSPADETVDDPRAPAGPPAPTTQPS